MNLSWLFIVVAVVLAILAGVREPKSIMDDVDLLAFAVASLAASFLPWSDWTGYGRRPPP